MKNYYEILEISKNASSEIIEKAYKTLAKKYHPDVQEENKKETAEVKFKEIGEAYEILSDAEKKSEYDVKYEKFIAASKFAEEAKEACKRDDEARAKYQAQNNAHTNRASANNNEETESHPQEQANANSREEVIADQVVQKFEAAISRAYRDAYEQRLRDYGYRVRYKKSFKDKLKNIVAIILTILVVAIILFVLWQFKPFREQLIGIYNGNPVIKGIVDIFIK